MTADKHQLKTLVRGAYDLQKLRIQTGNRIVGNFKVKLGQEPGQKEEKINQEGKRILASLRLGYKRITDGLTRLPGPTRFKGDGVIDTYTEFVLVSQYLCLERQEAGSFRNLVNVLKDFPIYTEFLEGVKGVGPAMAGVIISEFDISRARYPSSLWKYAGLDVAPDGRGRGKYKEHLVDYAYQDKEGQEQTRKGITFNPFLKTKLVGVLGPSFLKSGPDKSPYAVIYYDYKRRLENHPDHKEKTKGHRHNMAIRVMVKGFLRDLYVAWRTLEGLEVAVEYAEAKLGMVHNRQVA